MNIKSFLSLILPEVVVTTFGEGKAPVKYVYVHTYNGNIQEKFAVTRVNEKGELADKYGNYKVISWLINYNNELEIITSENEDIDINAGADSLEKELASIKIEEGSQYAHENI